MGLSKPSLSRRLQVQPVSPRVVELLNDALTFELTVTNTYFLHARMLDNWGFARLGKVFYDMSIAEMRDADDLINRILMFDGHPNVQKLNAISVGESAEEMLRLALDSENSAVAQFNASAKECHDLGDHGTAAVFEEMVRDEEKHADWFESQLDAVERVGLQQYLAQHIDAGSGPA
jgi:bacterioferritin